MTPAPPAVIHVVICLIKDLKILSCDIIKLLIIVINAVIFPSVRASPHPHAAAAEQIGSITLKQNSQRLL